MSEVWKKVNSLSWDQDEGKGEIERLKREGLIPVDPIEPEPVLNENAYWIRCHIQSGRGGCEDDQGSGAG